MEKLSLISCPLLYLYVPSFLPSIEYNSIQFNSIDSPSRSALFFYAHSVSASYFNCSSTQIHPSQFLACYQHLWFPSSHKRTTRYLSLTQPSMHVIIPCPCTTLYCHSQLINRGLALTNFNSKPHCLINSIRRLNQLAQVGTNYSIVCNHLFLL